MSDTPEFHQTGQTTIDLKIIQERLDKLETLILSTASWAKLFGRLPSDVEDRFGEMMSEVLELKKNLGCTSNLNIVE